jgi:hypothetical protein
MVPTTEASATRCPAAADVPATTHAAAVEASPTAATVKTATATTAAVAATTMLSKCGTGYRNERDCQKRREEKLKKI